MTKVNKKLNEIYIDLWRLYHSMSFLEKSYAIMFFDT